MTMSKEELLDEIKKLALVDKEALELAKKFFEVSKKIGNEEKNTDSLNADLLQSLNDEKAKLREQLYLKVLLNKQT